VLNGSARNLACTSLAEILVAGVSALDAAREDIAREAGLSLRGPIPQRRAPNYW